MMQSPLAQKSLPSAKIRKLDNNAKALGLNEQVLIENASSNLFRVIDELNLGKKLVVNLTRRKLLA